MIMLASEPSLVMFMAAPTAATWSSCSAIAAAHGRLCSYVFLVVVAFLGNRIGSNKSTMH